ncbi:hypothetical protein [Agrobacterium sp. NPDC090273]|uniref:hypothetical protein n=1 Tax=Agrobacterium sp. NPDC090273 TaxID=3363919 RepID=UPI00383B8432
MVSAVSGAGAAASVLSSSSTSSSSTDDLKAQIAAKQSELSEAADEKAKEELKAEIATLKAQLEELENSSKSQSSGSAAKEGSLSGESERIGTTNFSEETPFGEREAYV